MIFSEKEKQKKIHKAAFNAAAGFERIATRDTPGKIKYKTVMK